MKIFNNFTVIHCIIANFSLHITAVLMIILQHVFWEKKENILIVQLKMYNFYDFYEKYSITLL